MGPIRNAKPVFDKCQLFVVYLQEYYSYPG